jgi:hypothetical protein
VYNAVRQLKLLDQSWPIMDCVIELHKHTFFAGDAPSTLEHILERMKYRLGGGKDRRSKKQPQYLMKRAKVSEAFKLLLKPSDTDQARALWEIERYAQVETSHQTAASGTADIGRTADQDTLRRRVEDALDALSIDYAKLTNRCHRLLDDMRRFWDIDSRIRHLPSEVKNTSAQSGGHFDWTHVNMCALAIMMAVNKHHEGFSNTTPCHAIPP